MKISKWLIPQILIFVVLGLSIEIGLAFFWIILHELAHYIIAKKVGGKIKDFKIHILGATLEISNYDELTQNEQIIVCLAGPILNFVASGLFFVIYMLSNNSFIYLCYEVNLVLGVFNMIPAYPLDGARILSAYLSKNMLYKKARNITVYIGYCIGVLFIAIFIWQLFLHKIEIIILAFAILIIYEAHKEKGKIMYVIMGDIFNKKSTLIKNKYMDNKFMSVYYKQYLLNILALVEKNKFHIFYVLDENMKIIYTLSEDELIEALKIWGNITLKEYYNVNKSLK